MQNLKRVKVEPRDDGPCINVITRSGISTGGAKEKVEIESLIQKAEEKVEGLDLKNEKETFIEAWREMAKSETPIPKDVGDLKADEAVNHSFRHVWSCCATRRPWKISKP